ncbi:hypothetical protein [uncultured Lacinutrix sp.]|uniref:hypothetical protein n=1 Tax=uncultured Lacinutrix sp. TaxID=574032 RepID=UPI002628A129|nr:hypothetical protein [uncultured Lacinutrix sp.]
MKNYILIVFVFLFSCHLIAQEEIKEKRKFRFPIWSYHDTSSDILGVSVGLIPETISNSKKTSRTFGLRVEADPTSALFFLFGGGDNLANNIEQYGKVMNTEINQKVYGLNISSGNINGVDLYGVSINTLMQFSRKSNGISIAGFLNQTERANGILVAGGGNQSFISNGLIVSFFNNETQVLKGIQMAAQNHVLAGGYGIQIGLWNQAKNFRGVQLGLWNKNDKRSLPLINWQFKG